MLLNGWLTAAPRADDDHKACSWRGVIGRMILLLAVMLASSICQTVYAWTSGDLGMTFWPAGMLGLTGDMHSGEGPLFVLGLVWWGVCELMLPLGLIGIMLCRFKPASLIVTRLFDVCSILLFAALGMPLGIGLVETIALATGYVPDGGWSDSFAGTFGISIDSTESLTAHPVGWLVGLLLIAVALNNHRLAGREETSKRDGATLLLGCIPSLAAILLVLARSGLSMDLLAPIIALMLAWLILPSDLGVVRNAIDERRDVRWAVIPATILPLEMLAIFVLCVL